MKDGSVRLWALFPGESEMVAAIPLLTSAGIRLEEVYSPYPIPDV